MRRSNPATYPLRLLLVVSTLFSLGISECSSTDLDSDGYSADDGDCNDNDSTVFPGAAELCDGMDHSCDGILAPLVLWFPDSDSDGFGVLPASPIRSCIALPGHAPQEGDCNDTRSDIHPLAPEVCDALDNDCDLGIDEGLPAHTWRDADGDGFGTLADIRCSFASGYVSRRGDCNDLSAAVHPGAADVAGDGLDSDCGGTVGPDPHVGLSTLSFGTLAAALSTAQDGATVWVGPGVFQETSLSFEGRSLKLMSTDMATTTVIDANRAGRLFRFTKGETAQAVLDGFTLRNGLMNPGDGGAIYIQNSGPTLQNLVFSDNEALAPTADLVEGGNGGAIASFGGTPLLVQCRFQNNRASALLRGTECPENGCPDSGGLGGAVLVSGGEVQIGASDFESNRAELSAEAGGGAISVQQGALAIRGSSFVRNTGELWGGAIQAWQAELQLSQSILDQNAAMDGAGIHMVETPAIVRYSSIRNNVATNHGGGLKLYDGALELFQSIIQGNLAQESGAGLYLSAFYETSSFDIRHTLLADNLSPTGGAAFVNSISGLLAQNLILNNAAEYGGGIYLYTNGAPVMTNNIFLNNFGYSLFLDEDLAPTPISRYNVFYAEQDFYAGQAALVNDESLWDSNVQQDPELIRLTRNRSSDDDELLLRPSSAIRDLGDPSIPDSDGSPSEPGLGGGPEGASAYYLDSDSDGLYDGWELKHFGNLLVGPTDDPDLDGLSALLELLNGLYPNKSDSDSDGFSDGIEFTASSDALDWYSRPTGTATATVPSDFPTLQAAIDAGQSSASILAAPGRYPEALLVVGKSITLAGAAGREATVLDGEGSHRALLSYQAQLDLSDLSIENGLCRTCLLPGGGGLALLDSDLRLTRTRLRNNSAGEGGAINLTRGSALLVDTLLEGNIADYNGGALFTIDSALELAGVQFVRNSAGTDAGALKAFNSLTGSHLSFLDNTALRDGGALVVVGASTLTDETTVSLTQLEVRGNTSLNEGAALYFLNVTGTLAQATLTGNSAGIWHMGSPAETLTLENTIVAYNPGYNLLATSENGLALGVARLLTKNSNVYNPSGTPNMTGVEPSSTLSTVEPGFLAYQGAIPSTPHLSSSSPLKNIGSAGTVDIDGSPADLGMFGGPGGASWDRDFDRLPDWYWPGTRAEAPAGDSPEAFDLDDLNPAVQ